MHLRTRRFNEANLRLRLQDTTFFPFTTTLEPISSLSFVYLVEIPAKKAGFALLVSWLDSTSGLVLALMSFQCFILAASVSVESECCLLHLLLSDVYPVHLLSKYYYVLYHFSTTAQALYISGT